MVDKPEDSETQISGGEQLKPEKAGTPPEVDAEIVEDGYRQPESENSSAKSEPEETSAGAPPPKDLPPTPSSALRGPFGLSPGVMLLIVLVAVLVVGFAIWRLAGGGASTQQPAATTGAPSDAAPDAVTPAALPEGDSSPSEEAGETLVLSGSFPASARPAPAPGKIANTGAATAKEAAAGIGPSESSDASRGLPLAPAPATGGNETLQNAAKKAAKALAGPDTGDAIDLGDTEAPAGGEEIETPAPDTEAYPPPSADPAFSETPGEASDQEASLPGAEKLANDLTEMKAALAAAQTLNAQQADEIAATTGRLRAFGGDYVDREQHWMPVARLANRLINALPPGGQVSEQQRQTLWAKTIRPRDLTAIPAGAIRGYAGRRRMVLVADDDPSHRALIADLLAPVFAKLDLETLQELNGRVQVGGEAAAAVARDWLTQNDFLG